MKKEGYGTGLGEAVVKEVSHISAEEFKALCMLTESRIKQHAKDHPSSKPTVYSGPGYMGRKGSV